MKRNFLATIAFLLALFPVAQAGTFTKDKNNVYEYTGNVDFTDLPQLKEILKGANEGFVTIKVDSYGGYLHAGLELGRYVKANNHRIHMIAKGAYSAAAIWVIGDRAFDYEDKDSMLWFHLPSYNNGWVPEGSYQMIGYEVGEYFREVRFGTFEKTLPFMKKLAYMRDNYGIRGAVVWQKHKPEKYYDGNFDEEGNFVMKEVELPF